MNNTDETKNAVQWALRQAQWVEHRLIETTVLDWHAASLVANDIVANMPHPPQDYSQPPEKE